LAISAFQYIDFMIPELWLTDPDEAYAQWQRAEATGADRHAFANRSITQHCSMVSRLHDYLLARRKTVATFGADHVEGFFADSEGVAAPDYNLSALPQAD
jgi:hypothetical protein